MSVWTCHLPSIPGFEWLKAEYEKETYRLAIHAWSAFFKGLGFLELINLDRCLAGDVAPDQHNLDAARQAFEEAHLLLTDAAQLCLEMQSRLPEGSRMILQTPVDKLSRMADRVGTIAAGLKSGKVPNLETVHAMMGMIIEDMIVGAHMALVNRGTAGHFPYIPGAEVAVGILSPAA